MLIITNVFAIIILITLILVGFIIYKFARGSKGYLRCPNCKNRVGEEHLSCPHCGYSLHRVERHREPRKQENSAVPIMIIFFLVVSVFVAVSMAYVFNLVQEEYMPEELGYSAEYGFYTDEEIKLFDTAPLELQDWVDDVKSEGKDVDLLYTAEKDQYGQVTITYLIRWNIDVGDMVLVPKAVTMNYVVYDFQNAAEFEVIEDNSETEQEKDGEYRWVLVVLCPDKSMEVDNVKVYYNGIEQEVRRFFYPDGFMEYLDIDHNIE